MKLLLAGVLSSSFLSADIVINLCSSKDPKNLEGCFLKSKQILDKENLNKYSSVLEKSGNFNVVRITGAKTKEEVKELRKYFKDSFPDLYTYKMDREDMLSKEIPKKETIKTKKDLTSSNEYDRAVRLFNEKKYQEAYNLFEKLFLEDVGNININFFLGRSAFEIKNYDEAISAYDRVLISAPNNKRAKLEKARTLFELKLYDESKKEFKEILLDTSLPQAVRDNVSKFLDAISSLEQKHFFSGVFIGSYGFDDNTNSAPLGDFTTIANTTNTTKPQDDTFHQQILVFSHTYDMKEKGDDLFRQDFIIFNKNLTQYDERNVLYLSYAPKYLNTYNNYNYELSFNFDNLWYGGDKLQKIFGPSVKFTKPLSKTETVGSYFKIQRGSNAKESDRNKDFLSYEVGADYKEILSDSLSYVLKYSYQSKHVLNSSGNSLDVGKDTQVLSLDVNKNFLKDYTFKYGLKYTQSNFDYANARNYKRKDKKYGHALTISRPLDKSSLIDIKLNYDKTDSNQPEYDLDKTVYTINYTRSF